MDKIEFLNNFEKIPVKVFPFLESIPPVVSVIVQTYQHAEYIRECLEGIMSQETDFPFEVLLGEDCSSDGTREICIEFARKYPEKIRLFLHNRENMMTLGGNPTGRFNFLYNLLHAKGDYIAICEGDDCWKSRTKLQTQVTFLQENKNYAMSFHNAVERKGENENLMLDLSESRRIRPEDIVKKTYRIPTLSMVFRRSVIEDERIRLLTHTHHGDRPLEILCLLHGMVYCHGDLLGIKNTLSSGALSRFDRKRIKSSINKYYANLQYLQILPNEYRVHMHAYLAAICKSIFVSQPLHKIRFLFLGGYHALIWMVR